MLCSTVSISLKQPREVTINIRRRIATFFIIKNRQSTSSNQTPDFRNKKQESQLLNCSTHYELREKREA
jgi:hypothetical protein